MTRVIASPIRMGTSGEDDWRESSRTLRRAPARHSMSRVQSQLAEPARAPALAPQRERPPELDANDGPCLRAPARVQHHAQDAVDAESAMPEAGVGVALFVHLVFGPRDDATLIRRRQPSSSTVQPFWKGARTSVGAIGVYWRITVAILQPR
jgi:hypothetical protein